MVVSLVRAPWYRFRVGGEQVELVGKRDNPTQNEALEGVITTVVDAEILTSDSIGTNDTANVYAVDRIGATITAQFSGRVNHKSAQSYPNTTVLTCVGPLARLRRCTQIDRDLTGMTDGEAVIAILDWCNITFDEDDILDCGYELGAETPVYWKADQPAHEVIADLDRVFGTATIEIGSGRVVRFAYDRAPDAGDISVTYTRGVDAEMWRNQRDIGDLDGIVNLVQVTGASWEDPQKCTRTVWSRGVANNADLGGTARNRSMQFSSDFIQDESLAESIAERLLRWYNRQPDELVLVALNDQNVTCGDVLGFKDQANGIDLTADADESPYLVLTIDRRGDEMTLNCIGGEAGDTGTITTGVEKKCNKTVSTVDIPGTFTPPSITVPPAISVGDYDCETDGGPNGVCPEVGGGGDPEDLLGVNLDNWIEVNPTFTNGPSTLVVSAEGSAYYPSISIDYATDWHIEATVILDASANPHEVAVGIGNASGSSLQFGVLIYDSGPDAVTASARSSSETATGTLLGPGDDIAVVLDWEASSETLTWSVDDGTTSYDGAVVCSSGAPVFALHPMFGCYGTDPDFGGELTAFSLTVGS